VILTWNIRACSNSKKFPRLIDDMIRKQASEIQPFRKFTTLELSHCPADIKYYRCKLLYFKGKYLSIKIIYSYLKFSKCKYTLFKSKPTPSDTLIDLSGLQIMSGVICGPWSSVKPIPQIYRRCAVIFNLA
jgi:hypothetical protein